MTNSSERHPLAQPNQVDGILTNPRAGQLYNVDGVPDTIPLALELSPVKIALDVSEAIAIKTLQAALSAGLIGLYVFLKLLEQVVSLRKAGQQLQRKKTFNNLIPSGQI